MGGVNAGFAIGRWFVLGAIVGLGVAVAVPHWGAREARAKAAPPVAARAMAIAAAPERSTLPIERTAIPPDERSSGPAPSYGAPAAATLATSATSPRAMARPKSPPKRAAREPGEQLATVERAERALASGDAPEALRLVDEYDTKFPGGALLHEAAMVRIDALLKLGRPDEAATTADRFLAVHPASPYAAKLRRHLQSGSER